MTLLLARADVDLPLWTILPFVGLLVAVAVMPLIAHDWWHQNRNKALVSLLFGAPIGLYIGMHAPGALAHELIEYLAFISLLGSLYVISGGVRVGGSLPGTPLSNVLLLAFGALLANVAGTTGAAMLLLRPYLVANRARQKKVHLVVFFILIVANCGGCLTPLGDPPLFLGFLKGVPFTWTLQLWKPWLFVCGLLLLVFYILDRKRFRAEGAVRAPREALFLEGAGNLAILAGVIGVVLAGGFWVQPHFGGTAAQLFQCAALTLLAVLSFATTPDARRRANDFSWHPFVEVAVIFIGIFAAMIPALAALQNYGASLGVSRPWQFLWTTGFLSGLLDNAPTYLAFLSMAQYLPDQVAGTTNEVLAAISCGAVFFGAGTYIGNGPNFMVKAIAEHAGVEMPSFFGYLAWSSAVLLPVLAAMTLIFFR